MEPLGNIKICKLIGSSFDDYLRLSQMIVNCYEYVAFANNQCVTNSKIVISYWLSLDLLVMKVPK